jgi:hypothetical protein
VVDRVPLADLVTGIVGPDLPIGIPRLRRQQPRTMRPAGHTRGSARPTRSGGFPPRPVNSGLAAPTVAGDLDVKGDLFVALTALRGPTCACGRS